MASPQPAIEHAHAHRDPYLAGFLELLRFPSISTDPAYKADLDRCADWIVAEMARIGFKTCRKISTEGHPVVYGEWLEAGADKPTVLLYAHYDVQPVDPLDQWVSPPFEPTERDGKLYARGVVDDKCSVYINLKALESIFAVEGKLPINVKLFFEGEEESLSPNMQPFVTSHKDLLKADLFVICDGGLDKEKPVINYAGRGIVGAEVLVTGADHDLHSGGYGGIVHNPLHLASKIVASFHDDAGRVQIPGFYDAVQKLSDAELDNLQQVWKIIGEKYEHDAGAKKLWGTSIASTPERVTALPTVEVNGMWGGYQGPGMKTVIPSKAGFKVTMRLVNAQDPAVIAELFRNYVLGFSTDTAAIEVNVLVKGWWFTEQFEGAGVDAVQRTLEDGIGKRAMMARGGGSIPIVGMFQRELGIPITDFGLGSGEGAHAPNEYMIVEDIFFGIDMAIRLYYNLVDIKPGS